MKPIMPAPCGGGERGVVGGTSEPGNSCTWEGGALLYMADPCGLEYLDQSVLSRAGVVEVLTYKLCGIPG